MHGNGIYAKYQRHRRLAAHPWFDDRITLGYCDRTGRVSGVETKTFEEALDYIEQIEGVFG